MEARRIAVTLACGLAALVVAGCTTSVDGTPEAAGTSSEAPTGSSTPTPSNSPTATPSGSPTAARVKKDILHDVDPCSLLGAGGAQQVSVTKIGRDDESHPTCVYKNSNDAYRLYVELVAQPDLAGNPQGIGKLIDTTVSSAPAKIRRHPSNSSCTIALEADRPTVALFAVSSIEGDQDDSCDIARHAAALAVPVIRDRDFTEDEGPAPEEKDPCALLTEAQATQLGLTLKGPEYGGCGYRYATGNQFLVSYVSQAVISNPGTGKLTDTTIAGKPAKEKRQPHNSYCTYVLHPEQQQVVGVAAGGPPSFPQNQNCTLARRAAVIVSGNID